MLDLPEVRLALDGAERRFRHRDFRTNVAFVSDETGAIVEHLRYGAYGVSASYGAGEEHRGFVGRIRLEEGVTRHRGRRRLEIEQPQLSVVFLESFDQALPEQSRASGDEARHLPTA